MSCLTQPQEEEVHPEDIENGLQQTVKTLVVIVDLTKALDKVWKTSLLVKRQRKTVCDKLRIWF